MRITAGNMHFRELNEQIRACPDAEIEIDGCLGQRYIGSGLADKTLLVGGIPGNALGAYLDGGTIVTEGNAQDAAGDTMNDGAIIIHGSCGDGAGYAMRGGKIYIHGDVGYRAGIHMKAYRGKLPVLVVGGTAGSFLGEYQAGGVIVVLGLRRPAGTPLTGYFCGTGMHGGKMFLRGRPRPPTLRRSAGTWTSSARRSARTGGSCSPNGSGCSRRTAKISTGGFIRASDPCCHAHRPIPP